MSENSDDVVAAARQQQFLEVVSRDEAVAKFQEHLRLEPLESEAVPLWAALGRVLAGDVVSPVDVSGFDRSNVDGFAVRSADTVGASEERPRVVSLNREVVAPGMAPDTNVDPETATTIATGAMIPRGADAVVMVEDTELVELESLDSGPSTLNPSIHITRAVAPGANITFAGTDIALGETVLRAGRLLTSREIGVLAAVGCDSASVVRKPRVAVISTGNEILPPGQERPPGFVYDSNLAIISAAIEELGGEPVPLGVVRDDESQLETLLSEGLQCDAVVLSGGTSKGAGDLSYRVVERLQNPGVVVHGAALKPGKPICLAVTGGKPVVILPGFPTSAVFTFHEFVAPVLRCWAGKREKPRGRVQATVPMRINSDRGRTEFALVGLFRGDSGLSAYLLGKGSGSVTTYSCADGFIAIDAQTEIVEAGTRIEVQLLGEDVEPADLVVIGSHCVGLDILLTEMERRGYATKVMHVGSTGGLNAVKRGECDLAGIHLLDPASGEYNRPFLTEDLDLIHGYGRMQGIVYRSGDKRFDGQSVEAAVAAALSDPDCRLINRNAGSGTRLLIDGLLGEHRPPGYAVQAKSHNAVAAGVSQERGDWGLAIATVARAYGLAFLPVREERYDFVVPRNRAGRAAVRAFAEFMADAEIRSRLESAGFVA